MSALHQCRGLPGKPCPVLTRNRSGLCNLCEPSATRRTRNEMYSDPRWHALARRVIGRWRSRNGLLCPGYLVPGHQASRANPLTADHILPVSARPDLAYDETNIQVLCRECNARKGATMPASEARSR